MEARRKTVETVSVFSQKYLKDADYVQKKDITIYTAEKEIEIHYLNEEGTRLKASMGKASFWSDEVPVEGPRRRSSMRPWYLDIFLIL